jgi:S1-C subfamily serine protease
VASVVPGGPADRAGIQEGDVITKVDGRQVQDPSDISAAVSAKKPGDKVTVELERDITTQDLDVTLGTRPGHTP